MVTEYALLAIPFHFDDTPLGLSTDECSAMCMLWLVAAMVVCVAVCGKIIIHPGGTSARYAR